MKISFLGTTTLIFDDGKDQIMFDCHVTRPNLLRVGLCKIKSNEELVEEIIEEYHINRLRAMFISHSHYDHIMDAPTFLKHTDAELYGSNSSLNVCRGSQIAEERLHLFKAKDHFEIADYQIEVLASRHSPAKWYSNDLGKTIDEPLITPARKRDYKEGGSYDFLVSHQDKKYLIRPSCNYVNGELDGIKADVLFLGIGGLSHFEHQKIEALFHETIEKVQPQIVIPIHWDNFFVPLSKPVKGLPKIAENSGKSLDILDRYCASHDICYTVLLPLGSIEL